MALRTGFRKAGNRLVSASMPTNVNPNYDSLICHLDATVQESVILSGGNVLEWRDISNNGLPMHHRQTIAAHQPLWGAKTINGYTVLDWTAGTGNSDTPYMVCVQSTLQPEVGPPAFGSRFWKGWNGGSSGADPAAAGFTIFFVGYIDSTATIVNGGRAYDSMDNGHPAYATESNGSWIHQSRVRAPPSGGTTNWVSTTTDVVDKTSLFTNKYTVSNTTSEVFVDGQIEGTLVQQRYWPNSAAVPDHDVWILGNGGDMYDRYYTNTALYSTPWRGTIGEFMFFDESLPAAVQAEIENSLIVKWGI